MESVVSVFNIHTVPLILVVTCCQATQPRRADIMPPGTCPGVVCGHRRALVRHSSLECLARVSAMRYLNTLSHSDGLMEYIDGCAQDPINFSNLELTVHVLVDY